jgi:hypothetical protein
LLPKGKARGRDFCTHNNCAYFRKTGANLRVGISKKRDTFARFFNLRFMAFTYLLEIIKTLPPKKQQEMVVFLNSGLFNRSKHTVEIARLYQIILGTAPGFSEDLLNKDQICLQIFGESTLVPGRLEKVIAGLNKYLRSFLLIQQYCSESNEDVHQIDWARWLRSNGFAGPAQKVILKLKSKKDTEKAESLERYYNKLLIAEEEHEWKAHTTKLKVI